MFEQTRAIVLHSIKYSDSSVITHFYTEKFGRLSVMIRHSKNKRSVSKKSILQPLFLLNLTIQYKQNRKIQQCKEIVNNPVFSDIPFNIIKSSTAIFLAEFLSKVLKEEEKNPSLFDFLFNAIQLFDQSEKGTANFHLMFLYELSKFLGFYPNNNYSTQNCYFNLQEGFYSNFHDMGYIAVNQEHSYQLHCIANAGFNKMEKIALSRSQRNTLLQVLIKYYRFHLPGVGKIKSLEVLTQVFGD